jgi:hypothetical protein
MIVDNVKKAKEALEDAGLLFKTLRVKSNVSLHFKFRHSLLLIWG